VTAPDAVLVVGPTDIVGTRAVDRELVTAAFESIDDATALVGDRVVSVDAAWREVMAAAIGHAAGTVVLVCPSWWRLPRIEMVGNAARQIATNVVQLRRADVLQADDSKTIVEIAPEFVVVHAPSAAPSVVPRVGEPRAVAASIDTLVDQAVVVIDVPSGMDGAARLSGELARVLRSQNVAVSMADDRRVLRAAQERRVGRRRMVGLPARFTHPRVAALTGAGLVVTALTLAAAGYGADDATATSAWLVEGRVAVEVPADWSTERINSGPGSARVQVLSPREPHVAIQVTQSPGQESLAVAAEVLRRALGEQPDGVFIEFTASDRRAEKNVITYREIRTEHHVEWTVMLDRGVRIAIGCQHAPDRPAPERICEAAIRSARTLT
jgi:type VII secretion-associated protein (TIGR03931 family)